MSIFDRINMIKRLMEIDYKDCMSIKDIEIDNNENSILQLSINLDKLIDKAKQGGVSDDIIEKVLTAIMYEYYKNK